MNLKQLFELQAKLDERIEQEHPRQDGEDRLAKKILALQVELGELANEWRGFKYWSHDQEPRAEVKIICRWCGGEREGYFYGHEYTGQKEQCIRCHGTGVEKTQNRLLEEFVDVLHFILSIGLEITTNYTPDFRDNFKVRKNIVDQFNEVFLSIGDMLVNIRMERERETKEQYNDLFIHFLSLGEMLGFNWEQVEQAYIRKNQVNHERQDSGY